MVACMPSCKRSNQILDAEILLQFSNAEKTEDDISLFPQSETHKDIIDGTTQ